MSDTVGFVRKLPHQLVEAFRSTLEVVAESDLLVHVVDAAAPDPEGEIDAVRTVLDEIGAGDVPELLAFNKADVTPEAKRLSRRATRARSSSRPRPARASTSCSSPSATPACRQPTWSSCSCRTSGATSWPPCTARARC